MGGVTEEVLLARAYLSRVAEPASIPVWRAVEAEGPVALARAVRSGDVTGPVAAATAARAASADPAHDLDVAGRHGIRLVVPESEEWPHFAMSALEAAGRRRVISYDRGETAQAERGELIPPLALWVRGDADLAGVGPQSVAIVGARGASDYGQRIAADLAAGLSGRGYTIVSGGAFGIDAAAHRGALAAGGVTVLVSAGGLDQAYPSAHAELFDRVAQSGLLVSESPPGAAPQRRRFLTRNRLIATLGGGTVVVEAARRSGAMNTAGHSSRLGRVLMAVPGAVTSALSIGCHQLIADPERGAQLVTGLGDVLAALGHSSELPQLRDEPAASSLLDRLDQLDPVSRRLFDAFPARVDIALDGLARAANLSELEVIRALPFLELAGLVEASGEGYRIVRPRGTRSGRRGTNDLKSDGRRSSVGCRAGSSG